jgi:hypothetical protein
MLESELDDIVSRDAPATVQTHASLDENDEPISVVARSKTGNVPF